MNLQHLKYAVTIAETNSITQAAEKLFTAQPNLSRAMKELESTLGITIFRRTSKGIYPTPQGEEFLQYARRVLKQVDEIERIYQTGASAKKKLQFSISVPRASYIACAFTALMKSLDSEDGLEVFYNETNPMRVISNITDADYRLGILRYQTAYDGNFKAYLKEKELSFELINEFRYHIIFSKEHPLAEKEQIALADLSPYTEIAHADPFIPSLPLSAAQKSEAAAAANKHIYVFERGSQMDLLAESKNTFMWVSPVPKRLLDRHGLVERDCAENERRYRDLLIYKKGYHLSPVDKAFIDELIKVKRELMI